MSLQVYTARISTRDPDRFDVTRKSGGERGRVFAPSWAILRPAIDARRWAGQLQNMGTAGDHVDGIRVEAEAWAAYVPVYLDEMRASYRDNRAAWDALLRFDRRVLTCYCADALRCHRRLLAGILVKLGAEDRGELP